MHGALHQRRKAERIEVAGKRPLTVLPLARKAALVTTAALDERVLD
jgi:hypothetical protein